MAKASNPLTPIWDRSQVGAIPRKPLRKQQNHHVLVRHGKLDGIVCNGLRGQAVHLHHRKRWLLRGLACLLREVHAAQEVLEARVGAEAVERGIQSDSSSHWVAFLQPCKCLICVAQSDLNVGKVTRRNVLLLRYFLQSTEYLQGFLSVAA